MPTLKVDIRKIKGQGIYIQRMLDNLSHMKCELEALGCQVHIWVEGTELAGNEARTRDLLLGKKGVTLEGETVATANPAEWLRCNKCGGHMTQIGIGPVQIGQSDRFILDDDGSPLLYYRWRCQCGYETIYDRVKPESEGE